MRRAFAVCSGLGLVVALGCQTCSSAHGRDRAKDPVLQVATPGGLVARENPVVFKTAFDDETAAVKIGLRNTSARTVRIHNIRGSCGCVRVGRVPESLAPGAEVEVEFTLRLAGIVGHFAKAARILSDDPVTPELRIGIEGEVGPRLVIEPGRAIVARATPGAAAIADLVIRSGAGESLAELTAVASVPGVTLSTTLEETALRLRVVVPPDIEHPRGTITLRLGKYERVLRLTDGSTAGGVVAMPPGDQQARRRSDDEPGVRDGASALAVAFTGQDLGELEPCGCTAGMLGGLARRPARLAAFVEPGVPFLAVSGGALVRGRDPYDRLRFEAFAEALGAMDYAALAPTRRELAFVPEVREASPATPAAPMVAVDVDEDAVGGRDLQRMVRLEPGNSLVYVTGIPGDTDVSVPGLAFVDPRAALRELRGELPVHAPLIVLANVGEEAARDLARSAGRPTLVLYAGGWTDPGPEDVEEGSMAFAPYPAEGKFVGLARLRGRGAAAGWTIEYRPVESELPEDDRMLELRKAHRVRMRDADLVRASAADPRFAPATAARGPAAMAADGAAADFVGSAACASCHAAASESWATSRHAHAMATLRKTGDDADPACVTCHVVGYGTGRGFAGDAATPQFAEVGCEACHGPRSVHVAIRSGPVQRREEPVSAARAVCTACHDEKHDPNFRFETHWPRIAHGVR